MKFGYADHPKAKRSFDWLVKNQNPKGGWSCFGSGRNLDSGEPMSAFASLPRQKWTKSVERAVEKGAEFFLERRTDVQPCRSSNRFFLRKCALLDMDIARSKEVISGRNLTA